MTRAPSSTTVALRNQLLDNLRDAEQPLTTQQVAGRITAIAVYPQLCVLHHLVHTARAHHRNANSTAQAAAQRQLNQHLAKADSRGAYWHYPDAGADHAPNALLDAVQDA
ncbi:hypothetical protein ORI20_15510 [Mycobacterium sp. CVI_P3]|uniref:Uncharacterized protein n=1 Tax=Mycobacterium pinniadriaticum TaxID=2994102 RepID=A0ABT3SFE7_9MYCO|nr:hypothetical protein [Mycobacterium pinniadriaticum]MCX2931688.1 hypothetical protein [Mycobacterium pinniadriaticum]MCX2938237.1 hypothetical protein [Mycobacterium pinniadriaticum]